jgi:hypothetical protein
MTNGKQKNELPKVMKRKAQTGGREERGGRDVSRKDKDSHKPQNQTTWGHKW